MAQGLGVGYCEITTVHNLDAAIRGALCQPGPMLVRVAVDYRDLEIRWIECVRKKFTKELTLQQKMRFLGRVSARALNCKPECND
jgi:acetolactate synthase-1/2/3 large subunit